MIDTEKRPVLAGLLALVAVAVVVGVIGGLGLMIGLNVAGVSGDDAAEPSDSSSASLYLPEPTETEEAEADEEESEEPEESKPTESEEPEENITLSAAQTSVSPMQQIDLTGTYSGGDGAILQVQRLENGSWNDFPVTMSVSSQKFSTYVMTSRTGENTFRVIDTDSERTSNEITVQVG